jgi:hypothetical protein
MKLHAFPLYGRNTRLAVSNGGLFKMKTGLRLLFAALIAIAIGCAASGNRPFADPRFVRQGIVAGSDPGCERATLVSTGGAFPKDSRTLAIRWTGYTNYELVYNGQIILLDAHFDRGSMFPPLGFTAARCQASERNFAGTWTSRSYVGRCVSGSENWRARRRRIGDDR